MKHINVINDAIFFFFFSYQCFCSLNIKIQSKNLSDFIYQILKLILLTILISNSVYKGVTDFIILYTYICRELPTKYSERIHIKYLNNNIYLEKSEIEYYQL